MVARVARNKSRETNAAGPCINEPDRGSDAQLCQRIEELLASSDYPSLRDVEVDVLGGLVVLTGEVSSFYLKQIAQTAVLTLDDVEGLQNELIVSSNN